MGCATVRFANGSTAIVCGRGKGSAKPCVVCGGMANLQCDHPRRPKPSRARCNAWMCQEHAVHVGEDLDWCHPCAQQDALLAGAVPGYEDVHLVDVGGRLYVQRPTVAV